MLLYGGVFEAHSCQCSADTSPQGKEENERFREKQENRYENKFQAGWADSVRDNKGWDKSVYYLKYVISPSDRDLRQQQKKNLFFLNGRGLAESRQ